MPARKTLKPDCETWHDSVESQCVCRNDLVTFNKVVASGMKTLKMKTQNAPLLISPFTVCVCDFEHPPSFFCNFFLRSGSTQWPQPRVCLLYVLSTKALRRTCSRNLALCPRT